MKLTMKHRYILAGILSILFTALIVNAALAGTQHSMNTIIVQVNGYNMGLQEAVDDGYLNPSASPSSDGAVTSTTFGHDASQIWVYVNQDENTLDYFLSNGVGLCGNTNPKGSYTGSINPGHLADEIEIEVDGTPITLQDAIDGGSFAHQHILILIQDGLHGVHVL